MSIKYNHWERELGGKFNYMAKGILAIAIIVIASIGILIGATSLAEKKRGKEYEEMLAKYEIICINGVDYKTDDIKSLEYEFGHAEDLVTLTLKDDTVVNFDTHNYTLKDKK